MVATIEGKQNYFFKESVLIKCIRKIHNLSQHDFCILLGYSQSALSKIENGLISPDLKFIVELSQKLEIDLNVFRYGLIPRIDSDLKCHVDSNLVPKKYSSNGVISSKTVYFLLELIKNKFNKDIYSEMGISEDALCLSYIKYNVKFFEKLSKFISYTELHKVMQSYEPDKNSVFNENFVKSYIVDHKIAMLTKMLRGKDSYKFGLKLTNNIKFSSPDLELFLLSIIYFDLLVTFNLSMELETFSNSKVSDCEITIYACA